MERHNTRVTGYRGAVSEIELLPEGDASLPTGPDLVGMAQRALGYLIKNPDPEHNYDARFTFLPHLCPPFAPYVTAELLPGTWKEDYERYPHIDPVAIGDTESRNDIAINLMREMTGSGQGWDIQEVIHQRLVGYVREGSGEVGDDLCWAVPFSLFSEVDGPYAMPWATAMLLHSKADLFRLTEDKVHRRWARRLFEGLRRIAAWDTGRAFYPGGGSPFREGQVGSGFAGHYPIVIGPLVHYALSCGDHEALEFAQAMAEGFLADLQPGHLHKTDGHVHGHSHCQLHGIRGVAQLGALTGNWRYLDWAKRVYDFFYAATLDTGWAPEIPWHPDHSSHSETCLVADMLEMEVWMARAGLPHLWDRVDRTIRNVIAPAQFSVTPEFERLWREIHQDKSSEQIAQGLRGLLEIEGGFVGGITPNDLICQIPRGSAHHGTIEFRGRQIMTDLPGCCSPSGMRALHLAWANTVLPTSQGVMVNLAFDRDAPEASVVTEMPRRGHIQVTARTADDFWLRPPSWAPRELVKATRKGREVAVRWGGPALDYAGFTNVEPGEALELSWPLVRFVQQVSQQLMENSEEDIATFIDGPTYTYRWVGSTVSAVEPRGEWLPLY